MTDQGLIAFIGWCRMNHPAIVFNPEIARRVYDAYDHDQDDHIVGVREAARYPSVTDQAEP